MDRLSNRRRFLKRGALFVPAAFGILRAQNIMPGPIMRPMAAGGASYLLSEDFAGVGTPTDWTDRAPVNYDYDSSGFGAPFGDECLVPGLDGGTTSLSFAAQSEVWAYFAFRYSATGVDEEVFRFQNSGGTNLGQLTMSLADVDVRPSVKCGTTYGSGRITSALAINTTYHVWLHYKKGTGADGICDVEFATDGVRVGSGNYYYQMTDGNATTDATKIFVYRAAWTIYVGKVRVDDAVIGSNPT